MRFGDGIGHYELDSLPGNQFICWSHRAYIRPPFRGSGRGTLQHRERIEKARELGYQFIMATVVSTNQRELKILRKNGWICLHDEVSITEDGNRVELWGKGLL